MFLGRVVGEVWATRKVGDLSGLRLLVVEALDERRDPSAPKVTPVVAADPLGAAVGEHVVVAFGKAARVATLGADGDFAFEAAIVGIVDDFDVPNAPPEWRMESPRSTRGASGGGDDQPPRPRVAESARASAVRGNIGTSAPRAARDSRDSQGARDPRDARKGGA